MSPKKINLKKEDSFPWSIIAVFAFLFFAIVSYNFISIYLKIPHQVTAKAASTLIQLCVATKSDININAPPGDSVMNKSQEIIAYATNGLGNEQIKNVTFWYTRRATINRFEEYYNFISTEANDGDTIYNSTLNTSILPDGNCNYVIIAGAESACRLDLSTSDYLTVNNVDVPPEWHNYYNSVTTNFSRMSSWISVSNATIGIPRVGVLNFDFPVNFDNADIDAAVHISYNNISVDASKAYCLNSPASVELYDLSFEEPIIMRGNRICPEDICQISSFSNRTFTFHIIRFGIGISEFGNSTYFYGAENSSPFLHLYDDTDYAVRFIDENVTFYVNMTSRHGNPVFGPNIYCQIAFNLSENYTDFFNMSFEQNLSIYTYDWIASVVGTHDWRVRCYTPNWQSDVVSSISDFTITNRPPVLIHNIPDSTWLENTQLKSVNLNDYFKDPDRQKLNFFPIYFNETHYVSVVVEKNGELKYIPRHNWCGRETIKIYAIDPGGLSVVSNEIHLRVICIPNTKPSDSESSSGGVQCIPYWNCTEWSSCFYNNLIVRDCIDLKNCGTNKSMPTLYDTCYYEPSCHDLIKNNGETGVDCGGVCEECPNCFDLIRNGLEEGIDCGGYCKSCESCSDGIKNQDETAVDCGGSCKSCSNIEMPAYVGNRKELIALVSSLVAFLMLFLIAKKAMKIASILKPKMSEDNLECEEAKVEEAALLHLEALERGLPKRKASESAKELSFIMRSFFKGIFFLKYEFSGKDLSGEIKKTEINTNLKIASVSFFRKLEEIEFSGYKVGKGEISNMAGQARRIIISVAKEIIEARHGKAKMQGKMRGKDVERKIPSTAFKEEKADSDEISSLLNAGFSALKSNDTTIAKKKYKELRSLYDFLPLEKKQAQREKIMSLYNSIKEAEKKKEAIEWQGKGKASVALAILVILALTVAVPKIAPDFMRRFSITGFAIHDYGIYISPKLTNQTTLQDNYTLINITLENPENRSVDFQIGIGHINVLGLIIYKINDTLGFINFTPTNDQVNESGVPITVLIKVGDNTVELNDFNIFIDNKNDPPNITGIYPTEDNPESEENKTLALKFNYTASDPDVERNLDNDYLTATWLVDGEVGLVTVNDSAGEFNYSTGFCDAYLHNITLIVNDSFNEKQTHTWIANISNINRPPVWNESLSNNAWNEDTNITDSFNLSNFAYDLDADECSEESNNKDNMTFSYSLASGGISDIIASINQDTRMVTLSAPPNWCGNETIIFIANDTHNFTYSNNVTYNVTCIPDAPVLTQMPATSCRAHAPCIIYLNATDVDVPYEADYILFSSNDTSLFNVITINQYSALGLINFTPSSEGNYLFNITATDSTNLSDSKILNLSILINHNPELSSSDVSYNETDTVSIQLNGTDPDEGDNETLYYSASAPGLANFNMTSAGFINFTLIQQDVGNHSVNVTLSDQWGASTSTVFNLEVKNIEDAPHILPIPNKRAKINHESYLWVTAEDRDFLCGICSENLNFSINDTRFFSPHQKTTEYNYSKVILNLTPIESDIGNYSFNISVEDALGASDYKIFNLTVDYNSIPSLNISGLNATENQSFYYDLNTHAIDLDEDNLSFNWSFFNSTSGQKINQSETYFPGFYMSNGVISFNAEQIDVGNYSINITVSDGESSSSQAIEFRVFPINHPPVLLPIGNLSAVAGGSFNFSLNATDIDNDSLSFNFSFIGLSFPRFNVTTLNSTEASGVISSAPVSSDVGNYTINISVYDVNAPLVFDWEVINFFVLRNNTAPNVYYEPNSSQVTIPENSSQAFNQTYYFDAENDTASYEWLFDGELQNSSRNWTYFADFDAAEANNGSHNVTVIVSDSQNSTSVSWTVNVTNVNRPPVFGLYVENDTAFANGIFNGTSRGSIILASNGSGGYNLSGSFISKAISLGGIQASRRFSSARNITLSADILSGTSIEIFAAESNTSLNWSSWINVTDGQLNFSNDNWIKYKLVLQTANSILSPSVHEVYIRHVIRDQSKALNSEAYEQLVDLSPFFSDPDPENELVYNYTIISGEGLAELQFDGSTVNILGNSAGQMTVFFTANDGNASVSSNNMTISITITSEPSPSPSSGGGGSSSSVQIKNVTSDKPYALNILVPQPITMYKNETIVAPIKIVNNGNLTLKGINLSAISENKNIQLFLTKTQIAELKPGAEESTEIIIDSYQNYGSYEILVMAQVTDPKFNETNKIFINSLELGSASEKELNTKITYTRDLLSQNTECLELGEFLAQAQSEVDKKEYEKASQTLDSIIQSCKYLTGLKESAQEKPSRISLRINKNFLLGAGALLTITLLSLIVIIYTRRKFK